MRLNRPPSWFRTRTAGHQTMRRSDWGEKKPAPSSSSASINVKIIEFSFFLISNLFFYLLVCFLQLARFSSWILTTECYFTAVVGLAPAVAHLLDKNGIERKRAADTLLPTVWHLWWMGREKKWGRREAAKYTTDGRHHQRLMHSLETARWNE